MYNNIFIEELQDILEYPKKCKGNSVVIPFKEE